MRLPGPEPAHAHTHSAQRTAALALTVLALTVLAVTLAAPTAFADPPGARLIDRVHQAYQQTDQYHATVALKIHQQQGPWTLSREAEFFIALDRPNNRLLIDKPAFKLVVDGGKLRLKSDQFPGRHLEIDAPSPLTYQSVVQTVSQVSNPPLADLALLLAEAPAEALTGGRTGSLRTIAADDEPLPLLRMDTPQGPFTLRLKPEDMLVTHATLDLPQRRAQRPGQQGGSPKMLFEHRIESRNQPLSDDLFAFDTTNSQAVSSMRALTSGGGGGGGGQSQPAHALRGKDAPTLELRELAQTDEKVAFPEGDEPIEVVGFWVRWARTSPTLLATLDELEEWASAGDRPVAVVSVAVQTSAEDARAYMKGRELEHRVLLDPKGESVGTYQLQTVPYAFLLVEGKVEGVYTDAEQATMDRLEKDVKAAAKARSEQASAADKPEEAQ